ncbi:hypothetical protein [Flavobacterium ginsengisoli]|uniref:hypothetical protein n=1 Tax=Flavobacterium ginsengisoli TaxID=871694 RepID=UPI0024159683|nr:hypothetical protein [Flavobacterium ginsengisoli]
MSRIAKFVVIINDNVSWMEDKAVQFYTNLFREKDLGEKYAERASFSKRIVSNSE